MENAHYIKDKGVYLASVNAPKVKIDDKIYHRDLLMFDDMYTASKCKSLLESSKRDVKIIKTDTAFFCYTRNIR